MKMGKKQIKNKPEYIKREDAIDAIIFAGSDVPSEPSSSYIDTARENIEAIPAADVTETRHSYWIKDCTYKGKRQDRYFCANCNHWQYNKKQNPNESAMYMNFCPQCGNRMDGATNNKTRYNIYYRKYSIIARATIPYIKVVDTDDIYHEVGKMICQSLEKIENIRPTKPHASQEDCERFWAESGYRKLSDDLWIKDNPNDDVVAKTGIDALINERRGIIQEFVEKLHRALRMYGPRDEFNKEKFLTVAETVAKELTQQGEEEK